MSNFLTTISKWQPLLIGLLLLFVLYQSNEKDTFIQDREAKFKKFEDSLLVVNKYIYDENVLSRNRVDSLSVLNDSLGGRVIDLDAHIKKMRYDYTRNRHTVGNLDAESTVSLLSDNLSERVSP